MDGKEKLQEVGDDFFFFGGDNHDPNWLIMTGNKMRHLKRKCKIKNKIMVREIIAKEEFD